MGKNKNKNKKAKTAATKLQLNVENLKAPTNTPDQTPSTSTAATSSFIPIPGPEPFLPAAEYKNLAFVPNSSDEDKTNSLADSVSLDQKLATKSPSLNTERSGRPELQERFDLTSLGSVSDGSDSPKVKKTPDSLEAVTSLYSMEENEDIDARKEAEKLEEQLEPTSEICTSLEALSVDPTLVDSDATAPSSSDTWIPPSKRTRDGATVSPIVSNSSGESIDKFSPLLDTGSDLINFSGSVYSRTPEDLPLTSEQKSGVALGLLDRESSEEQPSRPSQLPFPSDRSDPADPSESLDIGFKSKFDTQDQGTPDSLAAMTSLCGSPNETEEESANYSLPAKLLLNPGEGFSNPSYAARSSEESTDENKKAVRPITLDGLNPKADTQSLGSIGSGGSLLKDSPEDADKKLQVSPSGSMAAMTSLNSETFSDEEDGKFGPRKARLPKSFDLELMYFKIEETQDLTLRCYEYMLNAITAKEHVKNPLSAFLREWNITDQSSLNSSSDSQQNKIDAKMSDLFSGITDSIKSTASAITRNEYVRKVAESMNDAIMSYPKAEMAVREATNEDPWGPTGPQMKKISEYTKSRYMEDYYNVINPLFSRMLENNKDAWRRVYKSLVLLDYLLKNASERFVTEAREKVFELRRLESYKYTDEKGKDQGINIRHRVKIILEMLNDDDKLQAERSKACSDDKSKYRGYDQYDIKMSSSSNSSSYDKKWGQSSSSNNYDDYKKDREVSNFSFSSNSNIRNRSPSPELGFADDSRKKVEEDDGFGDFVSSRSSQPAATNKSTPNPPKAASFFDAPPAIPPPSATSNYVAPPLSPVGKKAPSNFDLLGGFDDPTPAPAPATQNNSFDLFSLSSPVSAAAAPAPVPAAITPSADLFDFAPAPITQSAPVAPVAPVTANNGGFNGFDFGSFGGSSPMGATPFQPAAPVPQQQQQTSFDFGGPSPKVGNSFAGLDQFMSLSLNSTNSNAPKAKTLNQMMGGGK